MTKRDYRNMEILGQDRFILDGKEYHFTRGYHDAQGVGGYYSPNADGTACVLIRKADVIDAQGHKAAALLFN